MELGVWDSSIFHHRLDRAATIFHHGQGCNDARSALFKTFQSQDGEMTSVTSPI